MKSPMLEISTRQHTTLTRDTPQYAGGIRTHNARKQAAADPRHIPCGHRDPWSGYDSDIKSLLRPGQLCRKEARIIQKIWQFSWRNRERSWRSSVYRCWEVGVTGWFDSGSSQCVACVAVKLANLPAFLLFICIFACLLPVNLGVLFWIRTPSII